MTASSHLTLQGRPPRTASQQFSSNVRGENTDAGHLIV
jgi:hypothetical protein